MLKVTVRADDTRQSRVTLESSGIEDSPDLRMLRLLLVFAAQGGAVFAPNFRSFRADWGVQGGMPGHPLVRDHRSYEGIPAAMSRHVVPNQRDAAAKRRISSVHGSLVSKPAADPDSSLRGAGTHLRR